MARTSRYVVVNKVKKFNVALYIRLSEDDKGKKESESVKSQKGILLNHLQKIDNVSSYNFYVDDGYVGGNFERPAFKTMMNDIVDKKINCVIVKDLSRFGRNYIEVGNYLQVVFPLLDIRFISVNDNFDTEINPEDVDTLLIGLSGLMNEEYLKDLSIKARLSYNQRQVKGLFTAPVAPYGYKRKADDIHKLEVDPFVSEVVKYIYNSYIEKKSFSAVVKDLSLKHIMTPSEYKQFQNPNYYTNRLTKFSNIWTHDTVKKILTDLVYLGHMAQHKREKVDYKTKKWKKLSQDNWIIVKNTHEPIIDQETYDKVQEIIKSNTKKYYERTEETLNDNYFSGLIVCGNCGSRVTYYHDRNWDYSMYKCKLRSVSNQLCNAPIVRTTVIHDTVLKIIQQYIKIACDMNDMIIQINKYKKTQNVANLYNQQSREKQLRKYENDKEKLYQKYRDMEITIKEYTQQKEILEANYQSLKARIEKENLSQAKIVENEFISTFTKYKGIKKLDRDLVKTLIKRIVLYDGEHIEIDFNFKDEFADAMEFIEQNKLK